MDVVYSGHASKPSKLKCTETRVGNSVNDIRQTHPSGTNAYRLTATLYQRLVKPFLNFLKFFKIFLNFFKALSIKIDKAKTLETLGINRRHGQH